MILRTNNQAAAAYWLQRTCERCGEEMPRGRYEHVRFKHHTLEQPFSFVNEDYPLPVPIETDDSLYDEKGLAELREWAPDEEAKP